MKTTDAFRCLLVLGLALLASGCDPDPAVPEPKPAPAPKADKAPPPAKKVELARNLFFETQGDKRRVIVSGSICLTKGPLELLMTRKNTKEHEAVITADVDAYKLHSALLATGAKQGQPVQYQPKYVLPTGQEIKITVVWEEKGQRKEIDGREWVRDANSKKTLATNWVFAGSRLIPNPLDPNKLIYLANDGDLVCVANFESALLDIPVKSSKDNTELSWEANTEKIPPVGTAVAVIFEPIPAKKK